MTPNTRTLKGQSYSTKRWANLAWPKGSKSRGFSNAQDSAKFLGYEIYVRKDYATKRNSNGTVRRYFNGNVILHVSREVIKNKLLSLEAMKVVTKRGKETWVSKGRTYMIDNEAHEIVSQ